MTPEQRFLFDVTGYLHLEKVLTGEELHQARDAVDRLIKTSPEDMPPGFDKGDRGCSNGFAFDKSLEALTMHLATWPIVKELTGGRPRLNRGSLAIDTHGKGEILPLHCAREGCGWQTRRYEVRDGRIYSNDFIVFFYFTDVLPGDGGLVVLPGSHKAEFERPGFRPGRHGPEELFFPDLDDPDPELHPALANITPRAGDVVIITESLTHGALMWKPRDRDRRFLILRYKPQYWRDERGRVNPFAEEILSRLSPETRELVEPTDYTHVKEIVGRDRISLS